MRHIPTNVLSNWSFILIRCMLSATQVVIMFGKLTNMSYMYCKHITGSLVLVLSPICYLYIVTRSVCLVYVIGGASGMLTYGCEGVVSGSRCITGVIARRAPHSITPATWWSEGRSQPYYPLYLCVPSSLHRYIVLGTSGNCWIVRCEVQIHAVIICIIINVYFVPACLE